MQLHIVQNPFETYVLEATNSVLTVYPEVWNKRDLPPQRMKAIYKLGEAKQYVWSVTVNVNDKLTDHVIEYSIELLFDRVNCLPLSLEFELTEAIEKAVINCCYKWLSYRFRFYFNGKQLPQTEELRALLD